jgi:septation ring formation regulator EzrA
VYYINEYMSKVANVNRNLQSVIRAVKLDYSYTETDAIHKKSDNKLWPCVALTLTSWQGTNKMSVVWSCFLI